MPMVATPANAWRGRGYNDAMCGRQQRAPLRDDNGEALAAYLAGYRAGLRRKQGDG